MGAGVSHPLPFVPGRGFSGGGQDGRDVAHLHGEATGAAEWHQPRLPMDSASGHYPDVVPGRRGGIAASVVEQRRPPAGDPSSPPSGRSAARAAPSVTTVVPLVT